MKYKPKIKHIIAAALVAAASLFCLALPASANSMWTGLVGGGTGNGGFRLDNPPFSHESNIDQFAWRADLYVSTHADGKINKSSDTIGNELALVGSVLCTSPNYVKSSTWKTYIQTDYTNESRDTFDSVGSSTKYDPEGNVLPTSYTLPKLDRFERGADTYDSYTPNGTKQTVVIAKTESGNMELLQDQWGANNAGTDFTKVQDRLTKTGYEKYIKDFLIQLLDKDQFFVNRVATQLNEHCPNHYNEIKLKCGGSLTSEGFKKFILPVNPETKEVNTECMVEWALVLTPIYRFDAIAPFYYYPPGSNTMTNVSMSTCVALDAYWFAQYDVTSTKLYDKSLLGPKAGGSNSGNGVLSRWLGCIQTTSNSGAPGIAAYCTKEGEQYLGVYTQHEDLSQYKWSTRLVNEPKEYAKRGGIAVFTTKIEDSPAPVYYHTYTYRIDENDKSNLPSGYTPGTFSTDDPSLLQYIDKLTEESVTVTTINPPEGNTFSPKKLATDQGLNGLVVAAMAPESSLNQPGAQEKYPVYELTENYAQVLPDLAGQTKHTGALAESAVLKKDNGTSDNTVDDPKEFQVLHIHVDIKPNTVQISRAAVL